MGFAGAFRRSEIVALNVEDVQFSTDGVTVTLRRWKTDQDGAGRKVGIPYGSNPATCPVRALQAWLAASGITEGALFRWIRRGAGRMQPGRLSGSAVAEVVKRHAGTAGLDTSKYAGHSLRAGLVTAAAIAGSSDRAIMKQSGHRAVRWCNATSGMPACSARMPPPRWGSKENRQARRPPKTSLPGPARGYFYQAMALLR